MVVTIYILFPVYHLDQWVWQFTYYVQCIVVMIYVLCSVYHPDAWLGQFAYYLHRICGCKNCAVMLYWALKTNKYLNV